MEELLTREHLDDPVYASFLRGIVDLPHAERMARIKDMEAITPDNFAGEENEARFKRFFSAYDTANPRREFPPESAAHASEGDPGAVGGTGARGRESNPRISLEYGGHNLGDMVTIRRTDGSIESDWQFVHRRLDTGEIVVTKMINGKWKEKEISSMDFDEMQKLSSAAPENAAEVQPVIEAADEASSPERSAARPSKFRPAFWKKEWVEAKETWKEVFREATIGNDAEAWAESPDGPGAEKLLEGVNGLIAEMTSSKVPLATLKKYVVRVHIDEPTRVLGETIRVSAKTLMERNPKEIAALLVDQITETGNEPAGTDLEQAPKPADRRTDFWREKYQEWNNVFFEVVMHASKERLEAYAASMGYDVNTLFGDVDKFITSLDSHDLPLKKYRISIYEKGAVSTATKNDLIFLSLLDLMKNGPEKIADLLAEQIRKNENLPKQEAVPEKEGVEEPAPEKKEGDEQLPEGTFRGDDELPAGTFIDEASAPKGQTPKAQPEDADQTLEPEHVLREPTPNSDADIEVGNERGAEREPLSLDAARDAYVKAHQEYLEGNRQGARTIYGLGGDLTAVKAARDAYDAALKAAVEVDRKELVRDMNVGGQSTEAVVQAKIRKALFEKFVVNEEGELARLKASREMPPREQKWYERAWMSYARLPKWQKIAISTAIGTGVVATGSALGFVAGSAILTYAGKRVLSASMGAGAYAGTGAFFKLKDKTWGKKETKEYKIDELLGKKVDDLSQYLVDVQDQYGEILRDYAAREKTRTYWKVAASLVAGVGTSIGTGGALAHHFPSTADHAVVPGPHAGGVEHAAPEIQHVETAHHGDSLWTLARNDLAKEPGFNNLNDAQKTWMVSSLVNRTAEHHQDFGFVDPDKIKLGTTIDFSKVMNEDGIHKLFEGAGRLTAEQQAHIIENNQEIAAWFHAHPHEALTGARIDEILHPHAAAPEVAHVDTANAGLAHEALHGDHAGDAVPAHVNEVPSVTAATPEALSPAGLEQSLGNWSVDPDHGQQLFDRLHDLGHARPAEVHHLLLSAAQKVGDSHPVNIDPADTAAVTHQLRDYLVAYPEARQLGFSNYDHWAGVKDISVKKFLDETTIAPRAADLKSALHHSFWHRGVRIEELAGRKIAQGAPCGLSRETWFGAP